MDYSLLIGWTTLSAQRMEHCSLNGWSTVPSTDGVLCHTEKTLCHTEKTLCHTERGVLLPHGERSTLATRRGTLWTPGEVPYGHPERYLTIPTRYPPTLHIEPPRHPLYAVLSPLRAVVSPLRVVSPSQHRGEVCHNDRFDTEVSHEREVNPLIDTSSLLRETGLLGLSCLKKSNNTATRRGVF